MANKQPLKRHELVSVFYEKQVSYNPQKTKGKPYTCRRTSAGETINKDELAGWITRNNGDRYPVTILKFKSASKTVHPTQKPVALLEYLIKTYTIEGETVLDNCMGSGSTGIAAMNLNRNFIGIEKDDKYFKIAEKCISDAQQSKAS